MKLPDTENRLGKIANAIVIGMLGFNMVVIFLSFQSTIESYGLLEAFESDGSYLAWSVQQNIQNGTFSPHDFLTTDLHTIPLLLRLAGY